MDTEAAAKEIVSIRNRLEELEGETEIQESSAEEERARLAERLRYLQGLLSDGPSNQADQDEPAEPDDIQYFPPA